MMIASSLLAWIALAACQPGSAGSLDPVAASGVERVEDERWAHAAVVTQGTVTVRVVGRWASQGAQTLRITYRNGGGEPVRIKVAAIKITHPAGEAALWTAVDATGVDMTDAREDNNRPRILYTLNEPRTHGATLEIAPGQSREVDSELTSFADDGVVAAGDRVVATIPMPVGVVSVSFTLASAPLLPF